MCLHGGSPHVWLSISPAPKNSISRNPPVLKCQGIPGKTGPQERGVVNQEVLLMWSIISVYHQITMTASDYIYRACSFHTTAFMHTKTLLLISGYRIVFGASTNRKLVCVGVCVSLPCVPSYSASSQTTN